MQAVEHGLPAGLTLFAVTGMVLALVFSGRAWRCRRSCFPGSAPPPGGNFAILLPALPLLGAARSTRAAARERTAAVFFLTMAAVFGGTVLLRWSA